MQGCARIDIHPEGLLHGPDLRIGDGPVPGGRRVPAGHETDSLDGHGQRLGEERAA